MAAFYKKADAKAKIDGSDYEGVIVFGDPTKLNGKLVTAPVADAAKARAKKSGYKADEGSHLSFDISEAKRIVVATPWKESGERFRWLVWARGVLSSFRSAWAKNILVDLSGLDESVQEAAVDALVSACGMYGWESPQYGKKTKSKSPKFSPVLHLMHLDAKLQAAAKSAATTAEGTNLVRHLMALPTNKLDCKAYPKIAREWAKPLGLQVSFLTQSQLEKKGAGAFCAVARGSSHKDAGILKLEYKPAGRKKTKHVAVVGKGIVYDTGGVNVKTGNYMFGMHGDMGGSAVALATIVVAAKEKWPFAVTAYLAIAENAIGDRSYLPNEVVTALDGTTIEVVHTDAEGRMALADTLCLASEAKPDLIVDFATLTGSAVHAIGTRRSAGFANKASLMQAIATASSKSGERVWAFPYDDYDAEALKSEVADTKQCKLTGAVDHIEAACFLSKFVKNDIPWVHVDLSAAERDGGLGHVETSVTGFGVRFARELIFCAEK